MENIFTVAKPFLTFGNIFGVCSISFEGPAQEGILKTQSKDLLLSLISFMTLISMTYFYTISENMYKHLIDDKLTNDVWYIVTILSYLMLLCQFLYQFWKRKNLVKFLNLLQTFDVKVHFEVFSVLITSLSKIFTRLLNATFG